MHPTTVLRDRALAWLDSRFTAIGWSRRKGDFLWKRKLGRDLVQSIHFNVGPHFDEMRVSIIPSMMVEHKAIDRLLDRSGMSAGGIAKILSDLSRRRYEVAADDTFDGAMEGLWTDVRDLGLPFLEHGSQLSWV